jgi:ABC-type Mn2+/Zn2+ transport system permease subunit
VLTVRLFARTMRQFTICASLLGGVFSFVGFWIAYQWDLPVGPTDVVLLGIVYFLGWIGHRLFGVFQLRKGSSV